MGENKKPSYIDRMEHFILHDRLRLSLNEMRLYLYLFHVNNKAMWKEWFEADNYTLTAGTRLQERNLIRAKNGLKEKGLIDYQTGKRGEPTKYRLLIPRGLNTLSNFTVQNDREIEKYTIQNDSVTDSVTDRETASRSQKNQGAGDPLRHKTKDREREKRKNRTPTLEEVVAYAEEKSLTLNPKTFFDFYEAGDWKDTNGKPVKNWKLKAITWSNHENRAGSQDRAVREPTREERQREYEAELQRQIDYMNSVEG